jgi:hypothetical protein
VRVTFGYSTSNKIVARAIRLVTRQPASHSYIRYEDPWGEEVVLEATYPVVMERPLMQAMKGKKIIKEYDIDIPPEQLKCARDLRGKWYDFANIFMFLGMIVLDWVAITWRGWKSNPYHKICSDIQLKALGWPGEEKTRPWDIALQLEAAIAAGTEKELK